MRRLIIVLAVVALLGATGTFTYEAGRKLAAAPAAPATAAPKRATLVVPDVRNEAYVFAKEQLQDAGFAWHVVGGVRGYAANMVVAQSPAPGTKVVDTGAPLMRLTLARNGKYKQAGEPEDSSPYPPTAVRLANST